VRLSSRERDDVEINDSWCLSLFCSHFEEEGQNLRDTCATSIMFCLPVFTAPHFWFSHGSNSHNSLSTCCERVCSFSHRKNYLLRAKLRDKIFISDCNPTVSFPVTKILSFDLSFPFHSKSTASLCLTPHIVDAWRRLWNNWTVEDHRKTNNISWEKESSPLLHIYFWYLGNNVTYNRDDCSVETLLCSFEDYDDLTVDEDDGTPGLSRGSLLLENL
jgi:hypothetical protein